MNQCIRIIGGRYRGKKLHFPAIEGLRPTPDRVRETLFNWLMNNILDARCLDAFAGSGALGFEAFSRGARNVVLVEKSPVAYKNLRAIAMGFDSPAITVINKDASFYMQHTTEQFDLVFLDPPFAHNHLPHCLAMLEKSSLLVPGGLIYIESPNEITLNPEIWEPMKLKKAGQVVYCLYKKRIIVAPAA